MVPTTPTYSLLAIVGSVVILSVIARRLLGSISLPPMLGYIAIGVALSLADYHFTLLTPDARADLAFMAEIGIVVLLFRVGLESSIDQLVAQIRRASLVWAGDVVVSFGLTFAVTRALLGFELAASLIAAAALSATSLGVTAAIWRDANALRTDRGALLTDVAELDDISGVLLLVLVIAVVPMLQDGNAIDYFELGQASAMLMGRFLLFCASCFLFARYLERPIMARFLRQKPRSSGIIVVAGFGFIISGFGALLGFSLAIGALFAGLAFSRDPAEHRIDTGFEYLFLFFAPFFFVSLGLAVDVQTLAQGALVGVALTVAAAAGKLAGAGLPTWLLTDRRTAMLIGVSMIPRAEIAMIIVQQAQSFGDTIVPPELFSGVLTVSVITCLVVPLVIQSLLRRYSHAAL